MKNILILGPARSGKKTLARKISKEFGYSIISLDDIISAFETIPIYKIKHNDNDIEESKNFAPFLIRFLEKLGNNSNYYNGVRYVIEGAHIEFETLLNHINKYNIKNYDVSINRGEVFNLICNDIRSQE